MYCIIITFNNITVRGRIVGDTGVKLWKLKFVFWEKASGGGIEPGIVRILIFISGLYDGTFWLFVGRITWHQEGSQVHLDNWKTGVNKKLNLVFISRIYCSKQCVLATVQFKQSLAIKLEKYITKSNTASVWNLYFL